MRLNLQCPPETVRYKTVLDRSYAASASL